MHIGILNTIKNIVLSQKKQCKDNEIYMQVVLQQIEKAKEGSKQPQIAKTVESLLQGSIVDYNKIPHLIVTKTYSNDKGICFKLFSCYALADKNGKPANLINISQNSTRWDNLSFSNLDYVGYLAKRSDIRKQREIEAQQATKKIEKLWKVAKEYPQNSHKENLLLVDRFK